ncbi:hypothetical protein [Cerasicoccus fimbriatus]|uniref:hypothetical protein n=1 Tax=Cerasicoccus fimbriatus TaxID=3014554 RepID=UPI0022B4D52B|nr:hypothetical protein [Cerasicoccus sp. TK19100]
MKISNYALGISLTVFATAANAQFAIYDGFETPGDYTADTNVTTQTGGGSGDWGGSSWTLVTGSTGTSDPKFNTVTSSLNYSSGGNSLVTTPGSLYKAPGANRIIGRDFDKTIYDSTFSNSSTELWFSVVFAMEATTDVFFRAVSRDTVINGPGFSVTDGSLQAVFNSGTSTGSVSLTQGETYFILGRLQQGVGTNGDDVLDIWVNPDLAIAPIASGDLSREQNFNLTEAAISRSIIQSRNNDSLNIDEFRMGSTFDSVTPFTTVPEPTTFALITGMFMLTGALVIRHRRG